MKGAKAVLAANVGGYGQISDTALVTPDICGPDDAPAFSIFVKDANILKGLLKASEKGSVSVKLTAGSQVTRNGKSYNIVGEIPGKNDDEILLMMAHYDGYYHAFHDNASGVGLAVSIAKGLDEYLWGIDSNWYAYDFDKKMYAHFVEQVIMQTPERLAWGANIYLCQ